MSRPILNPAHFFRRIPLAPEQMRDRHTRTDDTIVLCHLGVPQLSRDEWALSIDGLVDQPLTLRFADLMRYPKVSLTSIHQCAGSPMNPSEPTRRICNVTWTGVRLSDVLVACRPRPNARYVWSFGADFGAFDGVAVDTYVKDLPLERVQADVLIAYELNGAPLPDIHGFPARLVVPGFYGTNSVKWLTRMTLAGERADSPFTTRWYNDSILDAAGRSTGKTKPVWSIAPQSIIVSPAPGETVARSAEIEIWGWAWGDGSVDQVDLSFDGGATWVAAAVEPPQGREWQRFALVWRPKRTGRTILCARARSLVGVQQPLDNGRNAVHRVEVTIA